MKLKSMPIPSINFAQRMYEIYKKRYFEQLDKPINDQEWDNLIAMDAEELLENGCHTDEIIMILTAQEAQKMLRHK